MLTCEEVSQSLSADALRTVSLARRLQIRAHLLMCDQCRRFAQQMTALGDAVRQLTTADIGPDTDDATARVMARLNEALIDPPPDRGTRGDGSPR